MALAGTTALFMIGKIPLSALAPITSAVLLLGPLSPLSATVVVYEPFSYALSNGTALGGVAATGTGLQGNWGTAGDTNTSTYSTSGLSFGSNFVTTSGGSLRLTSTGTVQNTFAGAKFNPVGGAVTGTLWNSYLVNWTQFSDIDLAQTTVRTANTANTTSGQYFLSQAESNKGTTLGVAAIGYDSASGNGASPNPAYATGTTYLMLSRYTNMGTALSGVTSGNATMWGFDQTGYTDWVNAGANEGDLGSFSLFTATDPAVTTGTFVLNDTRFLQFLQTAGGASPITLPIVNIDEVRFHTALSDIVAVPEPGSVALLLGGFGALFLMRRTFRKSMI